MSNKSNEDLSKENLELDPYQGINFIKTKAQINDINGNVIFENDVVFPDFFNENDINIVSSKYLCNEAKRKETSLTQMIDRVSNQITLWGNGQKYFKNKEDENLFNYKLKKYQIHQYVAFNSPVYFNVGVKKNAQASACFILGIEDSMDSITEAGKLEAKIFKQGSGSGINYSPLRSTYESVSGGGLASGPESFLRWHDSQAGVVRSGGTLRRSAKLACINMDHPDVENFLFCKEREEEKLNILRNADFKAKKGHDLSDEVYFQNTNISAQVPDSFMEAVENNDEWWTKYVSNGKRHKKYDAKQLLMKISELAWKTADPGLQFYDNINNMHTCKSSGDIVSSNPCSEYLFLNNSSCNLASINLLKFIKQDQNDEFSFDIDTFVDVIKTIYSAQDMLINNVSYPNELIEKNSHEFRPIGMGYSNLGATLMYLGFPYDSNEGREIAACFTALLQGYALKTNKELAEEHKPFKHFELNKESFYDVVSTQINSAELLCDNMDEEQDRFIYILKSEVEDIWSQIEEYNIDIDSFRNAQSTLLAPCGTVSSLMGCATTGIEPEFSLIRYKRLSGSDGATLTYTNTVLKSALQNLICSNREVNDAIEQIKIDGHVDNVEVLADEEKEIFDTSISSGKGIINYMGHVKMMAAVQPFLNGAISKTINLENDATVQDIFDLYMSSWKMGLKGVAIYRDGSKNFQPLSIKKKENIIEPIVTYENRKKMPIDREAKIHKFSINNSTKGYITSGLYDDGELGELFINISRQGSTLSGLMDSLATLTSMALQYHVPLKDIVGKLMHQKFEPKGFTKNPQIRTTSSLVDYIYRYLGLKFLPKEEQIEIGLIQVEDKIEDKIEGLPSTSKQHVSLTADPCPNCGSLMRTLGSCSFCNNCNFNSGACG